MRMQVRLQDILPGTVQQIWVCWSKSRRLGKGTIGTLETHYPILCEFRKYVMTQWLFKVHMYMVGSHNMLYPGQDTNAIIESYPSFMKSIMKA